MTNISLKKSPLINRDGRKSTVKAQMRIAYLQNDEKVNKSICRFFWEKGFFFRSETLAILNWALTSHFLLSGMTSQLGQILLLELVYKENIYFQLSTKAFLCRLIHFHILYHEANKKMIHAQSRPKIFTENILNQPSVDIITAGRKIIKWFRIYVSSTQQNSDLSPIYGSGVHHAVSSANDHTEVRSSRVPEADPVGGAEPCWQLFRTWCLIFYHIWVMRTCDSLFIGDYPCMYVQDEYG